MEALALATAAPVAYVAGFATFKVSARRMPRLSGYRVFHVTWTLASSPLWLCGLAVLISGLAAQSVALTRAPVSVVVPMYGPVMVVLLLVAVSNFGERVTRGQLRALMLLVLALLAFAAASGVLWGAAVTDSGGPWNAEPPLWKLALLVVPSILVPLWLFTVRDAPTDGRHAKRVTGVAFGLGAGVVVGCAESSGASIARLLQHDQWHVLRTPHPYIVVVAGLLGAALALIGLQRCRLSVVIIVLAVGSKASLWLGGIMVYGQPWPQTPGKFALSAIGLLLALAAVFAIPRHEPDEPIAPEPPAEQPPPVIQPVVPALTVQLPPAMPRTAAAMRAAAARNEEARRRLT
jgi:hypothetical protein